MFSMGTPKNANNHAAVFAARLLVGLVFVLRTIIAKRCKTEGSAFP
jgi:hypothetical protein